MIFYKNVYKIDTYLCYSDIWLYRFSNAWEQILKFSIITACLNEKNTIESTILSVINQTCEDWELIVIDGGSTDGTKNIIEKYSEKISCYISESDNGIYNAMNKGIKAAKGEFLLFLNANDKLHNDNVLANVSKEIMCHNDAKLLYGDVDYIDEKGFYSETISYKNIDKNFYFFFLARSICHQTIFYHHSLFDEIGLYDEKWKICADYVFNVECIIKNKVKTLYIPFTVADFRLGGFCNSVRFRKIQKLENNLFVKKYYPRYYLRHKIDRFLENFSGSVYKKLNSPFSLEHLFRNKS